MSLLRSTPLAPFAVEEGKRGLFQQAPPAPRFSTRCRHYMNCHYVSRSLTRSWETGQGQLTFYDFTTKTIDVESSKKLFARPNLNSAEDERWLGANVEGPLGRFLKRRRKTGSWSPDIGDMETYRALLLLVPLQIARMTRATVGSTDFDEIFQWSEARLVDFIVSLRSIYSMVIVQGHPSYPLFVREQGFFPVPVPGASQTSAAANAVPISVREAVMIMPRSMNRDVVRRTLTQGEGFYLNNCSLGTNANRVVIHPAVVEGMNPTELIAEIESTRARNVDCYRASVRRMTASSARFEERT